MIKYLTVIISEQPLAQREGMPDVIETRAVELPEDNDGKFSILDETLRDLGDAALIRAHPEAKRSIAWLHHEDHDDRPSS